jgi:hypothetical protein
MEEVNPSMIHLIHCKNFCKCHNVPPPGKTIKKNEREKKGIFPQNDDVFNFKNSKEAVKNRVDTMKTS